MSRLVKAQLGDDYDVIFLQGGASTQFYQVPMNFLRNKAVYTNTGVWATKAIQEANAYGEVKVAASSKDSNFNFIPTEFEIDADADYFHCTSNNTIFGTQMADFPKTTVPMFCDM
jgi:phosphoserine aminotransferase